MTSRSRTFHTTGTFSARFRSRHPRGRRACTYGVHSSHRTRTTYVRGFARARRDTSLHRKRKETVRWGFFRDQSARFHMEARPQHWAIRQVRRSARGWSRPILPNTGLRRCARPSARSRRNISQYGAARDGSRIKDTVCVLTFSAILRDEIYELHLWRPVTLSDSCAMDEYGAGAYSQTKELKGAAAQGLCRFRGSPGSLCKVAGATLHVLYLVKHCARGARTRRRRLCRIASRRGFSSDSLVRAWIEVALSLSKPRMLSLGASCWEERSSSFSPQSVLFDNIAFRWKIADFISVRVHRWRSHSDCFV